MSYELYKVQSEEGYAYQPNGNRLINFKFEDPSVIDMSKSYVVLNTSLQVTNGATLQTKINTNAKVPGPINTYVTNPGLGVLGEFGNVDYNPIALIRNSRLKSNTVLDLDYNARDVNILELNKNLYTKDLGDNQNTNLVGGGWSCLDAETRTIKNSVFMNYVNQGNVKSSLKPADVIIPLSDLFPGDIGKMMLYPSGLMGMQDIQLELENRFNLVDVSNNISTISIQGGAIKAADVGRDVLNLSPYNNRKGLLQSPFYVGQPIKFIYYKSLPAPATVKVSYAVILEISNETSATVDMFDRVQNDGEIRLKLNKTANHIFNLGGANGTITNFIITFPGSYVDPTQANRTPVYDDTPSFTVNKAELVLARRRLNPKVVSDYYSTLLKEGMRFSYWSTTGWNRNSLTDVNQHFTLNPQALAFMNLTPNGNMLYSLKDNLRSYRVTVNDMETTNRDILMSDKKTSSLYKHKIITTLGACNEPVKSLTDNLNKSLAGLEIARGVTPDKFPATGTFPGSLSITTKFFGYPMDSLPTVDEPLNLKLNMRGVGMTLSPSYLFVKYNKSLKF